MSLIIFKAGKILVLYNSLKGLPSVNKYQFCLPCVTKESYANAIDWLPFILSSFFRRINIHPSKNICHSDVET
jgi:hypothetical protein